MNRLSTTQRLVGACAIALTLTLLATLAVLHILLPASPSQAELAVALTGVAMLIAGGMLVGGIARSTLAPLQHAITFLDGAPAIPRERLRPAGSRDLQLLAEQIDRLLDRVETEFDRRQRFVNTVSHELRTPLTAITGTLDVLLLEPALDPMLRPRLLVLRDECERLTRLSQNLLLVGRAELGFSLDHRRVELASLLWDIAEQVRASHPEADLRLIFDAAPAVTCDPDRLRQAVVNLLDNALRHGRCPVTLGLGTEGEQAVIAVHDTGPGLSPDAAQRLRTSALPWDTRSARAGLGLAVARWVAEAHGGALHVRSCPRDTTFSLWLPGQPQAMTASRGDPVAPTAATGRHL